jgi:ATP-dependent Clp protease ATP-binding subunit ClpC
VPFFENKLKRFISYKALREIVKLSSRFLPSLAFPDKAVRLLDESIAHLVVYTKEKILQPKHIRKIVSEKTQLPLEELEQKEKEILLNLEKLLHQRIVDQDEAVKELANSLRRARADVKTKTGPMGTFLFLGPTGVGKTETAKALAELYFGSEKRMLRFDMGEYQNIEDINRLLGSTEMPGVLTTAVKENPFSLVLLDELEKAHPNILNLFLRVLDEGFLSDNVGRKIDFQNTMIVATSNAGAEIIRQDINQDKKLDILKDELIDKLLAEKTFKPEFINRFDGIVVFKPLSKQNLLAIVDMLLNKLVKNLDEKGISLQIEQVVKEKIVDLSYNPVFGAREMKRVIQDSVENLLAEHLLSGKIKRGDRVKIDAGADDNFQLLINQ